MKIQFWKSKDGWRWRVKSRNGKIVAESGEAFFNHKNAERAWHKIQAVIMQRGPLKELVK